jgi:hypothetical protein
MPQISSHKDVLSGFIEFDQLAAMLMMMRRREEAEKRLNQQLRLN